MPQEARNAPGPEHRIDLDPFFDAFARFHHFTPGGMADFLGCPEGSLDLLRGRSLPEERDPRFRAEARELARQMGASEARLLQWIRVAKLLVR